MRVTPKTPLQTFTLISLILIGMTVLATGFALSAFYRHAIVDRESVILCDAVQAIAARDLSVAHLESLSVAEARAHFECSFFVLRRLSGAVQMKIYNYASIF